MKHNLFKAEEQGRALVHKRSGLDIPADEFLSLLFAAGPRAQKDDYTGKYWRMQPDEVYEIAEAFYYAGLAIGYRNATRRTKNA